MARRTAKKLNPLIRTLLPEAFQSEDSANVHPAREARRLGGVAPTAPMLAVSAHARASITQLERLARARGYEGRRAGRIIGRIFSAVRDLTTDVMMSAEKSYRGTILGLHHGMGVFLLLEDAAIAEGDQELADFCSRWIDTRSKLIADAERELAWFAQHPRAATVRATLGRKLVQVAT
jgi:hypothetical protein